MQVRPCAADCAEVISSENINKTIRIVLTLNVTHSQFLGALEEKLAPPLKAVRGLQLLPLVVGVISLCLCHYQRALDDYILVTFPEETGLSVCPRLDLIFKWSLAK